MPRSDGSSASPRLYTSARISAGLSGVMFFFFKQKTAYEMVYSDWSSDVCSSDLTDTYDQLALEGYLEIRPRSAPTVATVRQPEAVPPEPSAPVWRYDFIPTTPDISLFPRSAWRRAVEVALRDMPDVALDYGDHRGRIELRETLASYLGRVRGVRVDPGRMVITQGFSQSLDLLCRTLAARGTRRIAMESPSLPNLWLTVRSWGLE